MDKYDVFLSCKSEDYPYAEEIYNFLMEKGINTFLASQELRKLGESEYRRAISKAIKEAEHMIVFASKAEYFESRWVEYEWDMFVHAKLRGMKDGNLVTILKDVSTDDIPMDLWKYQSYTFDNYKSNILSYVETPASRERKESKKNILKDELKQSVDSYRNALSSLKIEVNKIYEIAQELDITEKECPICNTTLPLRKTVCPTCGWHLTPFEGIKELADLIPQKTSEHEIYSTLYNDYVNLKNTKSKQEKEDVVEKSVTSPLSKDEKTGPSLIKKDQINDSAQEDYPIKAQEYIEFNFGFRSPSFKLKKIDYADGDFYISHEELPARLCMELLQRRYGLFGQNKFTKEEFDEILKLISYQTGYTWDIPTLHEWTTAYNNKALKVVPYNKDLCIGEEGQIISIQDPNKYTLITHPQEAFYLHPVIRVKDNPGLL